MSARADRDAPVMDEGNPSRSAAQYPTPSRAKLTERRLHVLAGRVVILGSSMSPVPAGVVSPRVALFSTHFYDEITHCSRTTWTSFVVAECTWIVFLTTRCRYAGVLAAHSKLRSLIIPRRPDAADATPAHPSDATPAHRALRASV